VPFKCNLRHYDVETAKQFLRDMNLTGLPYEVAMVRRKATR
jgi:hypothetical protein